MAPRASGSGPTQITFLVMTRLASTLVTGAITAFNVAFTLLQIPIGAHRRAARRRRAAVAVARVRARATADEFRRSSSGRCGCSSFVMVPVTGIAIVLASEVVRAAVRLRRSTESGDRR